MNKTIIAACIFGMFSLNVYAANGGEGNNTNCNGGGNNSSPCIGDPPTLPTTSSKTINTNTNTVPITNAITSNPILVNAPITENIITPITNNNNNLSVGTTALAGATATNTNSNSSVAYGGTGGTATSTSTSMSQGGAVANSGNATNASNNTGTANVVVQGDQAQARDPVATAIAPTVVTGSDQCLVPVALGGQAVGFGISFGMAIRDENCEVIKLSREVGRLAGNEAALQMLRKADARVDAALESVGK